MRGRKNVLSPKGYVYIIYLRRFYHVNFAIEIFKTAYFSLECDYLFSAVNLLNLFTASCL